MNASDVADLHDVVRTLTMTLQTHKRVDTSVFEIVIFVPQKQYSRSTCQDKIVNEQNTYNLVCKTLETIICCRSAFVLSLSIDFIKKKCFKYLQYIYVVLTSK